MRRSQDSNISLFVGIYKPILLMQFAEGTIFLHITYDIVHHLQQIFLSFLHQHTNLTVSKGSVQ